ncbi:MAG: glycosyltransferase family 4 protein [Planctomycetota bacterium]
MPRILFVSHSSRLGGAERCLVTLLQGLPRTEYEPRVLARRMPHPFVSTPGLAGALRPLGIAVEPIELRWWARPWQHDGAFAAGLEHRVEAVARYIRRHQIDLVMTNSSVVPEAALAAAACGVPHVWHVLEMLSRDPGLSPFLPLDRYYGLLGELSRRVIVVSEAVRREMSDFAPHVGAQVVHTGVRILESTGAPSKQRLFGFDEDACVATFVGLHSARKGVLDFVEAARLVLQSHPQARFVMVGRNGGLAAEARRRVHRHGIGKAVRMLGERNDVATILAASDLFVLPALADPLPVAVLEAMSLALPVVATRSGGCEEMVVDGETGYLTPVRDPAALAAAVGRLAGDPAARLRMGALGCRRFQDCFRFERYVRRFQEVFAGALREPPPAPRDIRPLCEDLARTATRRGRNARRQASARERCEHAGLALLYRAGLIH